MFLDPEASQENLKRPEKAPKRHPKRHPKVVQKSVKKWLKSEPKTEQKKRFLCFNILALTTLCPDVFEAMGLSKNAYKKNLKDSLMVKNGIAKNGPKMIPKWFKIAQIA